MVPSENDLNRHFACFLRGLSEAEELWNSLMADALVQGARFPRKIPVPEPFHHLLEMLEIQVCVRFQCHRVPQLKLKLFPRRTKVPSAPD